MRPSTLAAASRQLRADPNGDALAEFMDMFYSSPDVHARRAMLAEEPDLTGDQRDDAFLGAIASYLAKRFRLGEVPCWAQQPCRFLDAPWHTSDHPTPATIEYLTFSSPAEFRVRNIFTDAAPLRRARPELPTRF
jgi:hypothetical protein